MTHTSSPVSRRADQSGAAGRESSHDVPAPRPRRMAMRCLGGPGSSRAVRRAVLAHCDGRVPEATLEAAQLVASELITNGVEHGDDGVVTIDLAIDPGWVTITVTSPGDPRRIPPLGTWTFPASTTAGGRGLALAQSLSDSVEMHNRWAFDEHGSWIGITVCIALTSDQEPRQRNDPNP